MLHSMIMVCSPFLLFSRFLPVSPLPTIWFSPSDTSLSGRRDCRRNDFRLCYLVASLVLAGIASRRRGILAYSVDATVLSLTRPSSCLQNTPLRSVVISFPWGCLGLDVGASLEICPLRASMVPACNRCSPSPWRRTPYHTDPRLDLRLRSRPYNPHLPGAAVCWTWRAGCASSFISVYTVSDFSFSYVILLHRRFADAVPFHSLLQINVPQRHSVSRSFSPDGPNGRGQM